MKLDKFILAIAEKAGIQASDPKLAQFLSYQGVRDIEVPDEVERGINQNLLSLEDAKNNHPQIKSHYFGEIMANVDRSLDSVYRDAGFTADEIGAFNQERSSTKRIPLVMAALKTKLDAAQAAQGQNGAAGNGADQTKIDSLNQQITELNNQLATTKTLLTQKESEFTGKLKDIQIDNIRSGKLGGLKTIYDTLPADVRTTTLKTLLDKELQDNGIQLILDETTNQLKLQKKDGSNFFDENNRLVDVDGFINKTLAKHKVLPQNASDNGGNQQQQNQQQQNGQSSNGVNNNGSATGVNGSRQQPKRDLSGLYGERIESLNNANPTVIL